MKEDKYTKSLAKNQIKKIKVIFTLRQGMFR